MTTSTNRKANRLISEKSPYLLQHAFNPVDWYPWGTEAFEAARREDKPIFLSVGYSTCYWCHVMEREVFENETIAAAMNEAVISIKVDREERPDVDRVYMAALQAMTGSGGWPMSMFLTPALKPFFGATYIPPTDQYRRPGFPHVLERVRTVWSSDRDQILQSSERVGDYLKQLAESPREPMTVDERVLDAGFGSFERSYDSINGGFGGAPKFPRPVALNFLLRYYSRTKNRHALEMALHTLRHMANGGIHDHLGGGFHRYATDERWHVPHFEKMLYDQAQLSTCYLEAFQITHDRFYASVAKDTLDYVLRDLAHSDGGFFSAEDAESAPDPLSPEKKEEGAYYTWSFEEVRRVLPASDAHVFCRMFGIEEDGNVLADPHGVFRGKNILFASHSIDDVATQLGLPTNEASISLSSARTALFTARSARPRCHLDDKILTSWNGLMISALAKASQILSDQRYLTSAQRAAGFILNHLRDASSLELLHRFRDGESRIEGQLEDYAFFIQSLIDLYEASFDPRWMTEAAALTETQNLLFHDGIGGGFFDTSGRDDSVLVRTKEWYDGAEPGGNAIAILNLLRLEQHLNKPKYGEMARTALACFGERVQAQPQMAPQLIVALDFCLSKPLQVVVAGSLHDDRTNLFLAEIHNRFLPRKILILTDAGSGHHTTSDATPFINALKMIDGRPTVYVCENYACKLPITDPGRLDEALPQ